MNLNSRLGRLEQAQAASPTHCPRCHAPVTAPAQPQVQLIEADASDAFDLEQLYPSRSCACGHNLGDGFPAGRHVALIVAVRPEQRREGGLMNLQSRIERLERQASPGPALAVVLAHSDRWIRLRDLACQWQAGVLPMPGECPPALRPLVAKPRSPDDDA